jgi:hypothetical protein
MSEKETILVSIRALTNRLLPGAEDYASEPPPGWKRWTRPKKREPIDDVIATLISRRRVPKLKPKAALVGITCPFWYARAGVVMAIETAILTENEAKENRRLARQRTSELLRSRTLAQNPAILRAAGKRMGNSAKALSTLIESAGSIIEHLKMVVLLEPSLYAAVQANPVSLHARTQWRNDELFEAYIRSWDKFVDHANPLAEALVDIQKVARTALLGASNNPPAYFQRTFVEKMAQSFASLTGGAATSGTVFRDFVTAAWTSAFPDSTAPVWERIIRNLRASDRP